MGRDGGRKGAGEARARTAKRVQLTPQPGDNIYNSVARLNSFGSVRLCPESSAGSAAPGLVPRASIRAAVAVPECLPPT